MTTRRANSTTPKPLDDSLLVLFDGHALFHRAFHAIKNPLSVSKTGEPVTAVYGFTSSILKALGQFRPAYAAVAFDRPLPTLRHKSFAAYKAQRPSMPDDMRSQFPRIRQMVETLGLPIYELDDYEADDVLGCLATRASEQGLQTIIVTGDTDTMQLVSPTVRVLFQRGLQAEVTYDLAAVRERYGLEPSQISHLKALRGDPSDNIPGVPGVGEKTATALLQKFGTVPGIYEHLAEVTPEKVREILRQHEPAARQGLELVTIVTECPLVLDRAQLRWTQGFDRLKVVSLFRELEFNSLLSRLPDLPSAPSRPGQGSFSLPDQAEGAEEPVSVAGPGTPAAHDRTPSSKGPSTSSGPILNGLAKKSEAAVLHRSYRTVSTPEDIAALAAEIAQAGAISLYVHSSLPDLMQAEIVGLAIAWDAGKAAYLPLRHRVLDAPRLGSLQESPLKPILEAEKPAKVLHVAREVITPLANEEITLRGLYMDTSVAAHLLGQPSLALPNLVLAQFGDELPTLAQVLGTGRKAVTFEQLPLEEAASYACAVADYTLRLASAFEPALRQQGTWKLFTELEMPLTPVIVRMERNGITVDVEQLHQMARELHTQMTGMEVDIYEAVGHRFNVNSPKQLGDILFEELHLPHGRRTQTGWSTDAAVLEGLRGQHPVVARILEYREVSKLVSTYLDALPGLVNPATNRIHTTYNQTGSATGRISSNDPNLQNIPVRSELGKKIRLAFVASKGSVLMGADYSQIDLRVLAHLSGDEALQAAFRNGEDIHAATAAAVLNIPREKVTSEHRRIAKTVNFGIVYGMSGFGLAARMEMDRKVADQFITAYFARYPKVQDYMKATIEQARTKGYVETMLGRRRHIPEVNAGNPQLRAAGERMAINMPVQGTSADIIKLAMLRMQERLDAMSMESKMLLQIHDELLFEVPQVEAGTLASIVQEIMPDVLKLDVPLQVEIKLGRSWGELE